MHFLLDKHNSSGIEQTFFSKRLLSYFQFDILVTRRRAIQYETELMLCISD